MNRSYKIIADAIKTLNVDISGKIVMTEVGSQKYLYTPIIASMCGASKVYALAKDNKYGLARDIIKDAENICSALNIKNILFLENEIPDGILETCDIVTNSGNLRPINSEKILKFKTGAVIPLMFEAWEFRNEDIDLALCKTHNIKVGGTWENHPAIKVFDYCGMLGVKMSLDAGFEVTGNNIIVWSDDDFGKTISAKFKNEGANVTTTTHLDVFYEQLPQTDFVFLADYHEERTYFGESGLFDHQKILSLNNDIVFVHLYGNISLDFCLKNNIHISPSTNGYAKLMTHTLGYVGLIPILKLQVAGFKVAQEMLGNEYSTLTQLL